MRQQIDRTFDGARKPGRVGQHQIDDHVIEAHGPDSAPQRTSDPPKNAPHTSTIEDPDTPNEESSPFFMDDEVTSVGNHPDTTPPPISTRLGDYLPPALFG